MPHVAYSSHGLALRALVHVRRKGQAKGPMGSREQNCCGITTSPRGDAGRVDKGQRNQTLPTKGVGIRDAHGRDGSSRTDLGRQGAQQKTRYFWQMVQ